MHGLPLWQGHNSVHCGKFRSLHQNMFAPLFITSSLADFIVGVMFGLQCQCFAFIRFSTLLGSVMFEIARRCFCFNSMFCKQLQLHARQCFVSIRFSTLLEGVMLDLAHQFVLFICFASVAARCHARFPKRCSKV